MPSLRVPNTQEISCYLPFPSNMTSLPKTFKQAVFKEAGAPLTIEDTALTLPGNGDLLVKVEACGVCASDVYAQAGAWGGGFPFVPGHEYIGHVAAVGNDVSRWRVGDRVGGGWHGGHDGKTTLVH